MVLGVVYYQSYKRQLLQMKNNYKMILIVFDGLLLIRSNKYM